MPMPEVLAFHYTLPLWDPDGREIVLKEFLDHLDAVVTHLAP